MLVPSSAIARSSEIFAANSSLVAFKAFAFSSPAVKFASKLSFAERSFCISFFSASCSAVATSVALFAIERSSAIFACNSMFSSTNCFLFSNSAVKFSSKLSLYESNSCIFVMVALCSASAFAVPSSAMLSSSEILASNSSLVAFNSFLPSNSAVKLDSKLSLAKSSSCILITVALYSASAFTVPSSAIARSLSIFRCNSLFSAFKSFSFSTPLLNLSSKFFF